jgi:hypothetical protein
LALVTVPLTVMNVVGEMLPEAVTFVVLASSAPGAEIVIGFPDGVTVCVVAL